MQTRSIISQAHQMWKAILGAVLLVGGAATDMIVSFMPRVRTATMTQGQFYDLQLVGLVVAAAGFAYLCTRVRCPKCGARWIWMAANGKLKSLDALVTLDRCPTCEFAGNLADPKVES